MSDWSTSPSEASASGNAARLQAMLKGSPQARNPQPMTPTESRSQESKQPRTTAAPRPAEHADLPLPPLPVFDPALFDDPAIPASFDGFRVEGLKQHLWRYGGQLAPSHAIARLEDPAWLAAWDAALASTRGERVLLRGSELGTFGLRALPHGARHALCVETHPLNARIAAGMAQKHFLPAWHAQHGADVQAWSEDERRRSFEAFAGGIDVVTAAEPLAGEATCDVLVFPAIDHTLLGTGIAKAVRQYRAAHPHASL